ncbi:MFS transporter [Phaeobacter gallaeciensis]|uniref:MFS transporter n=1 Tax=Phaeobacter gallaeciensis TaxID=60890 RepID=UPI00237FCF97|nr:MFS transporter [Phaeobacter gallaeciensis]MDE4139985.1 MFS transporter [Phaeobacter gallaeciensis]MDE4148405.1 MFS transporter [Phaeobacter gallaeciensis]MDE4152651.1 MFS transporter [Phaeobacter gallaeciensis]MDE4228015.1 MFS transporter [Phaeobacter gallaeciensis]MDE4257116.1 MFS transporter [Phaeobacter gallaeciensis]
MTYTLGIRENLRPFLEQLLQVFFVGMTIGLQRTVIPALAETEFGVVHGSMTAIFAFVVSFGIVKGAMNFVSGRLSERVGRRRVLIWGWLVALPIPFMILWAPSWGWIVAANVLLGVNQGFCWSMTVTAKMDIVKGSQRGMATGFNEFAGYGGVAAAGLLTGYLASYFDPRTGLFAFGLVVILLALAAAALAFTETLPFARAEAARHKAGITSGPQPRYATGPDSPTTAQVFALVSWRNRTFTALAQAGSVEKFVDALMWALVPVFLVSKGASLIEIGWITGLYGFVWGGSQLWTGPLSDVVGRKWPTVVGFFLCSGGVITFPFLSTLTGWAVAAAVSGVGMALLYPTLIAAMGDIAHPSWRGSALGVYRFWRDLGYAIGALAMGLIADATGMLQAGFWLTGAAMALSGFWLILGMEETHPRINPALEQENTDA